jgi:hypothetical protein
VGGTPRRPGLARAAALAARRLAAVAVLAASASGVAFAAPTSAASGWQRPIKLAPSVSLDVFGSQLAFAADGTAAVGYGVQDVDNSSASAAFALQRTPDGKLGGVHRYAGAQQVLAAAFNGTRGELLAGTSQRSDACCGSVEAIPLGGGRAQTLVRNLAGATEGRLVAFGGQLLAAIATERGVWVAQSGGGRFGGTRRLGSSALVPAALDATATAAGQSVVVWAAGSASAQIGSVYVARGATKSAPAQARRELTAAAQHSIDELALASGARAPTLSWIESWTDLTGRFRSQVMVADLARSIQRRALSPSGELASGIAAASNARGDEAVAWKACDSTGACIVRAALRTANGRFGNSQRLGAIDPSETPTLALSPDGIALLGWVQSGHVVASSARLRAHGFDRARTVSSTNFATDLRLEFGPAGQALAVWTQGTLQQTLMGAVYSTR